MDRSKMVTWWRTGLAGVLAVTAMPLIAAEKSRAPARVRSAPRDVYQVENIDARTRSKPVTLTGIETDDESGSDDRYAEFDSEARAVEVVEEDTVEEPAPRNRSREGRSRISGRVNRTSQVYEDLPDGRLLLEPDPILSPVPASKPSLSAGLLDAACSSSCCDLTNDPGLSSCFGQKLLLGHLGTVFLHRSAPRNDVLVVNPFDPSQNLNAKDFNPGWGFGIDAGVTLLNTFSPGNDLDLRFLGINDWNDQQVLHATGAVTQINSNPPILVNGAQDVTSTWSTQFRSFEANWRTRVQDQPYSLLAGFRYIEMDDRVDTILADPAGVLTNSALHLHTQNRLYGFQTGMNYNVFSNCKSNVSLYSRTGIFGNATANSDEYRCNCVPPVTYGVHDTSDRLSFLSELGVNSRVGFGRGWFFYGQYGIMWLTGVSTATDQLSHANFTTGSGMMSNGQVFFHGGTIGIERAF